MVSAELWNAIHGNISEEYLANLEPTNVVNIYYDPQSFINPFVYARRLAFTPINFFQLPLFCVKLDKSNPYFEQMNALTPEQIKGFSISPSTFIQFAEKPNEYSNLGDWVTAFEWVEKRVGLTMLTHYFSEIPDKKKYDCFVTIYQRSESGFEVLADKYQEIFSYAPLSKERNKRLKKLREKVGDVQTIDIFHGAKLEDDPQNPQDKYSWTLEQSTAEWFAKRHGSEGEVWKKTIPLEDALDYLPQRGEEEILYDLRDTDYEILGVV